MPLDFQPIPIPIQGLNGKAHELLRSPGSLDEAINVEMLKLGQSVVLQKRPGYQRVSATATVGEPWNDVVWVTCATLGDELVLCSYDHVFGLGDRGAALRGSDAIVWRGPTNRSACRVFHVGTSRISQDYDETTGG